jgi:phosphoserine phosphatase
VAHVRSSFSASTEQARTGWVARDQVSALCSGWCADQVGEIVSRHLMTSIVPHVYVEARELLAAHAAAGHDVIIVSSSGQEMVAPIGACWASPRSSRPGWRWHRAVGHPHAVNPDRALRKIARARGWPVLAFGSRSPDIAGLVA